MSDMNQDYENGSEDPLQERQEQPAPEPAAFKRKKRSFLFPLFGGVCLGALLMALIFGGVLLAGRLGSDSDKDGSVLANSPLSRQTEEKLSSLKGLLDLYYLYKDDVTDEDIENGIIKGYVNAMGDPYTVYYDKEETAALFQDIEGSYSGVGASLQQNRNDMLITVVKCFEGAPAYEGGLLPGDIIVKVDDTDVTAMDIDEAVSLIKGEEGTDVRLTIAREGESDYIEKTFTRQQIDIPTVESEVLNGNIGYIQVSNFDSVTPGQFSGQLEKLEEQGIEGLVVDLRDNPGGVMDAALDLCEEFIPQELLVYTEDRYGNQEKSYSSSTEEDVFGKPVAVLVNGNSASASEIMAGAMKDTGRGTIVGTTTFGKGIVQQVLGMEDGTALKVTMCKYYTPKGNDIHEVGITPDVEVELDESLWQKASWTHEEDNQLQEALRVLNGQIQAEQ